MKGHPIGKLPGRVFLLFLAMAAVLCFPVLLSPTARVVGNIEHPGLHGELFHASDIMANARAGDLLHCFRSARIAWPEGQDLREFTGFSLHLFFYLAFLWIHNPIASYNALLIVTLALNGYCAYLLGRQLTRQFWPALLCGVMFLLSPYALLKTDMGFLQKVVLWWIPLFLRDLLRFLDSGKRRHAIWAGLAWSLMLLTYAPYAWYAVWAGALLAGFALLDRSLTPRFLATRGWPAFVPTLAAVLFLIVTLPYAGGTPKPGDGPAPLPQAVESAPTGSLDIAHPLRFHPYHDFMPGTDALPLGLSLVGLLLAGVALLRRRRHAPALLAVALFFLIVTIGPYPHTGGRLLSHFPLPYYFFACHLPWGARLGFPIRALPFVEIALAALSALALTRSHASSPSGADSVATPQRFRIPRSTLRVLAVLVLVVLERAVFLPALFPPRTTSAALSPALNWLKQQGGVVLHVPCNIKGNDVRLYTYITARTDTRMMNHYLNIWTDFPTPPLPDPSFQTMQQYMAGLQRAGCNLILVHPALVRAAVHPMLMQPGLHVEEYTVADTAVFRDWCGAPVYSNDASFIAYRVPPPDTPPPPPPADDTTPDIPEAELRAYFDSHPDRFRTETQIRVHHFFVPLPPDATVVEKLVAEEEARRMHAQAAESSERSFELADRLTRNDAAGRRWGDIGYIARGCLPADVEDRLFRLESIGTTILMERPDGYHVFRLMDIRPGHAFDFDAARPAIRDAIIREAREAPFEIRNSKFEIANMVLLPGGEFWMGSTEEEIEASYRMAQRFAARAADVRREWFEDEAYRLVRVRPFYMDTHEVTMADYRSFLEATGHAPLPDWAAEVAPDDNMPAVGVSLPDARAYALWKGKRLPTVQEWAWAARGADRRRFPWGTTEPDGTQCNYADAGSGLPWSDLEHNDGFARVAPVGSYPGGATPEGLQDMAGNVREWTASAMRGVTDRRDGHIWSYAQRNLVPPEHRSEARIMYCVRGGGWSNAADDMRCADERMLPPDTRDHALGFRCAMDAGE